VSVPIVQSKSVIGTTASTVVTLDSNVWHDGPKAGQPVS